MRTRYWLLLILLLIAAPSQAQSQNGCPDGQILIPQEYVDPVSNTRQVRYQCIFGQSPQVQMSQFRRWLDQWGAISIDKAIPNEVGEFNGLGIVRNRDSKRQAKRHAVELCVRHGGEENRCRNHLIAYKNSCGAFAISVSMHEMFGSTSRDKVMAREGAIRKCQQAGATDCQNYRADCAPPFYLD